jgi:hypothetical protein
VPSYRVQLNIYDWLLQRNGYDPCEKAALVYFDPRTSLSQAGFLKAWDEQGFSMKFDAKVLPIALESDKVVPPLLEKVRTLYDSPQPLKGREGCKNCLRIKKLMSLAGMGVKPEKINEFSDWVSLNRELGMAAHDAFGTALGWVM